MTRGSMNAGEGAVQATPGQPRRARSPSPALGVRLLAVVVLTSVAAASARAGEGALRVRVSVRGEDGIRVGAAQAVAWLSDLPSSQDPGAGAAAPAIASRQKTFVPRVVAVPVGASVRFPNDDPIFHNVFSSSEVGGFDLGLYRNGDAKSQVFTKPGVVPIYCNIHPRMLAYVVVVPSRAFGVAPDDGVVELSAVPTGRHALAVWHERGGSWSGSVEVAAEAPTEVEVALDASSWREVGHLNKYGKPYPPPDDDETRY